MFRAFTGLASALVTAYGVYAYAGLNLSFDTLPASLYCFLPMLSFPVFLLSFWRPRLSVALHCAMLPAFLAAYSALNWRTCAELGYCGSVLSVVVETLKTRIAGVTFAVAVFNLATLLVARRSQLAG